ncbi:MAG TPA: hypothetical protein VFP60_09610 [Pseudolabrys sp.]|nr:hypothetical protein [Pseudolabrys sp.]
MDEFEYRRVRRTAFFAAAAAIVWTAFCVIVVFGRLDTMSAAQLRTTALAADDRQPALAVHALATTVTKASQPELKASRPESLPAIAGEETSGDVNSALPLRITLTNVAPGSKIRLTGLAAGTKLSAGSEAASDQWLISSDDLPNVKVIPPADYAGTMTIVAELRSDDERTVLRTPVRLHWRLAPSQLPTPPIPPSPSKSESSSDEILFTQFLAWQRDVDAKNASAAATDQKAAKAKRHATRAGRKHAVSQRRERNQPDPDLAAYTDVHRRRGLATNWRFSSRGTEEHSWRTPFWNGEFERKPDALLDPCDGLLSACRGYARRQ